MSSILQVQNISKRFQIHRQGLPYLSFRDKLTSLFKPNEKKEAFWALQDISFDVKTGDAVGIIGRNGAGKSTLLKILSRITPPTSGRIVSRGRIASLLEVGTGFHQELTGRENIFMNGSILGMKRHEIAKRFDEIVDFSGVEKFLDTPLKHYSSGMQLRLAFAVAAHLEPEILIVDEVLAVGDAEFQRKCLKKMEDVSGEGRTLLFVSHNLPSLKSICRTGILIKEGRLVKEGALDAVIDEYTSYRTASESILSGIHYFQPHIKIQSITINGSDTNSIILEESVLDITMDVEFLKRTPFELDVHLKKDELPVASYANFVSRVETKAFDPGRYQFQYKILLPPLRSGRYKLDLYFTEPFISWFALSSDTIEIDVINSTHHTFLNNTSLKWGSVLLSGSMKTSQLD